MGHKADEFLLVMTTCPEGAVAKDLAQQIVEKKLAACVSILAPCESVYRWRSGLESSKEVPLMMKTTRARYAPLETFLRQSHPYELPELIAVPLTQGLPEYLQWIKDSLRD